MNISGTITLFVNIKEDKRFFTGSISSKQEDGTYANYSVNVRFNKEAYPFNVAPDGSKYYELEITKGFISVDKFQDKTGIELKKLALVVSECKLTKEFQSKK